MVKTGPEHQTGGNTVKTSTGQSQGLVALPIEHIVPDGQIGLLSNHFVIQREGPEFHLLFFQTQAPIILGETEEDRLQAFEKVGKARSICVARIIVAAERLPSFIAAMQENVERYGGVQPLSPETD